MQTDKLGASNRQQMTVLASSDLGDLGSHAMSAQAQEIGDEILVTGSRIVRRDLDASSPIVTVDAQRLENSSTISIESVLNQMPQFVPEGTQFDSGQQSSGADDARYRERQPARHRPEPHARARRRPPRAARERLARRRLEHDSVGGHRAHRDDHGRCVRRVRRRRSRRRRQLRAEGRLRRRRHGLPDQRHCRG